MRTLRAIIVDDENLARRGLSLRLQHIPQVEVIAECANGAEALKAIAELGPDLVFLDIQMPGMDGFSVVSQLQADNLPMVIFVTAYDEYAIRAFEVSALDYLLKPFSRERLAKAILRAQEALAEETDLSARLAPLLESLASQGQYLTRLAVRDRDRICVLDAEAVDWIGVEEEQVMVHVGDQAYAIRRTLADLDPAGLARPTPMDDVALVDGVAEGREVLLRDERYLTLRVETDGDNLPDFRQGDAVTVRGALRAAPGAGRGPRRPRPG